MAHPSVGIVIPPVSSRSSWYTGRILFFLATTTFTRAVSFVATRSPFARRRLVGFFSQQRPSSILPMEATTQEAQDGNSWRFCDIGANLLDERFLQGVYRGTPRHAPDIAAVLERAQQQGVAHIIITAGTLEESRRALQYAREWNRQYHGGIRFGSTVGVHPTRCTQVFEEGGAENADEILQALYDVCVDGMSDGTVVAYGELGLDYDRLEFCAKSVQHHYLQRQLQEIALPLNLPLFLHNRNAQSDLLDLLLRLQREHTGMSSSSALQKWNGTFRGVVHSFDDIIELAQAFIEQLGLFIGINGCSLRTEENLATVRQLPLERILLETDCPYCEVRSTHAGYSYIQTHFPNAKAEKKFVLGCTVKNRQEPCHIVQIAEIVAHVREQSLATVSAACYENSRQLFFAGNQ